MSKSALALGRTVCSGEQQIPPNLNQNSYFHSSYRLASKQKRGGMGPRTLAIEEIILINKI